MFKVRVTAPFKALREREVLVERYDIRTKLPHEEGHGPAGEYSIGEWVEVQSKPNHPVHSQTSDISGWRRA